MLGNLINNIGKKRFKSNEKKTKISGLRYYEFLDGSFLEDLKTSLTDVGVLRINERRNRQLSGEHSLVKENIDYKVILQMGQILNYKEG